MILRVLVVIVFVYVLPLQSSALSPSYSYRRLYEQSNVSPSPSPSHRRIHLASGGSDFEQSCYRASRSCQLKDMAACLTSFQSEEIYLLVQNKGENPLHVKIIILPTNNTIQEIDLSNHQMKKINISSGFDPSGTIALNSSVGYCILLHSIAPPPENYYRKYPSYGTYINPINGAYFVILLIIIIGGSLTFVKLRINNKVAYHELEMESSAALSSLEDGTQKWDQDWDDDDDDWGDKKPVKVEQSNGLTIKLPNSNGRRKEWDD